MGKGNDRNNEQRHNGQQRVVGNGPRQQQPLILTDASQGLQGKDYGVREYVLGGFAQNTHVDLSVRSWLNVWLLYEAPPARSRLQSGMRDVSPWEIHLNPNPRPSPPAGPRRG